MEILRALRLSLKTPSLIFCTTHWEEWKLLLCILFFKLNCPQCRYLLERIQTLLLWPKILEENAATNINPLVLLGLWFLPASPHTRLLPLILQACKDPFGAGGHVFGLNLFKWLKSSPSIPAYLEEWRQHWCWGVPEGIEAMSPPQSHPNKEHSSSQQGCICHVGSKDGGKGRFGPCHNYFSIQSQ